MSSIQNQEKNNLEETEIGKVAQKKILKEEEKKSLTPGKNSKAVTDNSTAATETPDHQEMTTEMEKGSQ